MTKKNKTKQKKTLHVRILYNVQVLGLLRQTAGTKRVTLKRKGLVNY